MSCLGKNKEILINLLMQKNNNDKTITFKEISQLTGFHEKSLIRLNKKLKEKGMSSIIIHSSLGKKRRHADWIVEEKFIIEQKEKYPDLNFLNFFLLYNNTILKDSKYSELIQKFKLKKRSYSYIYQVLSKAGFCSPHKHYSKRISVDILQKSQSLLLFQNIEFKLENPKIVMTLYLTVDVIENQVIYMHFSRLNSKTNYYLMLYSIIKEYGIPEEIYGFGLRVFNAPKNHITQLHRMCNELNINVHLSLDRKIQKFSKKILKELKVDLSAFLENKKTGVIQEINILLKKEYMPYFNNLREKNEIQSVFIKFHTKNIIERTLCEKYNRKIVLHGFYNNVQFRNTIYHIEKLETKLEKGTDIVVCCYPNGDLKVCYQNKLYETTVIKKLTSVKM